jgi:hypothetical protein
MKKSTFKKIMFRIATFVGMVNILTLVIGFSFPLFCEFAELCGAKSPGGGSVWAELSKWCFIAYAGLSPLMLAIVWFSTTLGIGWLMINWAYFKARYWDGPTTQPSLPDNQDDYALKFGPVREVKS